MIAVVESGSTKSDWRVVSPNGTVSTFHTAGFNPYFSDTDAIIEELRKHEDLMDVARSVWSIYFYGAGCSSIAMKAIVADALEQVFIHARVRVEHDMLGAALAAGQGSACIVSILGTGANCCRFDGKKIDNGRESLGYILGDEAGGAWFGKRLIADYLHGLTPLELSQSLKERGVNKEHVLQRVYREPRPNTFLAGFMPLLTEYRNTEYVQRLLHEGMTAFLARYVCYFSESKVLPLHFVGSVAYFFQDELCVAAVSLDLSVGRIVRHPIEELVSYHVSD